MGFSESVRRIGVEPDYHGMNIGKGGDGALFKIVSHEHGHVLDAPIVDEKFASDHANAMKEFAPRALKKEEGW